MPCCAGEAGPDSEAADPDDASKGFGSLLVPTGALELFQVASSLTGLSWFSSAVDFLGEKLSDLLRGELLRVGDIGALGFKIDFTNGTTAD